MTRVKFWGVRGSIPTPGPGTVRYGGNTSCVEVRSGDEIIILDAGTGLRALGAGAAGGIQKPAAQPHAAAHAHALGPHPGPAVFCADLQSPLPPAHSRLRRRAQRPGRRAHRPDGKHLFSRAVRQAAQQHRNRGTQGIEFRHRRRASSAPSAPIIPAFASATGCSRPTA